MSRKSSRSTGRRTLAEIAARAGVSPITASRALRDVPTVDPELARRVREAAEELDYTVNVAARTLASTRGDAVVVLVPSLSNLLFIDTLEAIHGELRGRGLEMLIGNFHYSAEEEHGLLRGHLARLPRGLLLTGFAQSEASERLLARSGVPRVHMMDLAGGPESVPRVGFSQAEAGAAVARHLRARGRRRLAFVAAQLDPRSLERGEGFRRAALEGGGTVSVVELRRARASSVALGAELFGELIEEHPGVDGVFFNNDDLAHGALFEAARRGVPIPERISVVGFNDLPLSAECLPRLSSVRTPREAVGAMAARQLLRLIDGEALDAPCLDLGFELVARESS